MEFRYDVIQLNRLSWRDFLNKPNPVAAALMAKMNIAHADRVRVKLECLRLLATLRLNRAKMKLTSGFVDAYLELNQEERKAFEAEVKELATEETEEVMQIVTSWMKEGIKQGRREGRTEGRREGRTEGRREGRTEGRRQGIEEGQLKAIRGDVLEILQARFKRVPARVNDVLKAIKDRKHLRLLLRQAATAPNLKEFERRLAGSQ